MLAGAGVTVGVLAALPVVRLLRALLFGINATDPATFLSVSLGLLLVAVPALSAGAARSEDRPRGGAAPRLMPH
jgi:hypothetical protein